MTVPVNFVVALLVVGGGGNRAAGLRCMQCVHQGEASSTPTAHPSTRLVFNRPAANCSETEMQCRFDENYCLFGYAFNYDDSTYWVQKGCVVVYDSEAASRRGERGQFDSVAGLDRGCVVEYLDYSQISRLPPVIRPPRQTLQMNLCLCRERDYCNEGLAAGVTGGISATFCSQQILFFLLLSALSALVHY